MGHISQMNRALHAGPRGQGYYQKASSLVGQRLPNRSEVMLTTRSPDHKTTRRKETETKKQTSILQRQTQK